MILIQGYWERLLTFVPGISVSNNVATCNGNIEKEEKLDGKIK